LISNGARHQPGEAIAELEKNKGCRHKPCHQGRDTAMNRRYKQTPPLDLSAALTFINIKVLGWKRLSRRRFETSEIHDQAAFESLWPQILTNFFYAETERVSRALGFLSEDRNN
jgi:hypothetical protein